MTRPSEEPSIAALLDAERSVAPASSEIRAEVTARLTRSLDLVLVAPAATGSLASSAPTLLKAGASANAGNVASLGASLGARAARILLVFVLGAGVGAGAHSLAVRPREPRHGAAVHPAPIARSRAEPVSIDAPSIGPLAPIVQDAPTVPLAAPSRRTIVVRVHDSHEPRRLHERGASAAATNSVSTNAPTVEAPIAVVVTPARDLPLAREEALLDTARSALARHRPAAALAALRAHETDFGRGRLSEERDAMFVQALLVAGDRNAARASAAAFHTRYPHSMFGAVIDSALRTIE